MLACRGIKLAQSSSDNALKLECAEILETLKVILYNCACLNLLYCFVYCSYFRRLGYSTNNRKTGRNQRNATLELRTGKIHLDLENCTSAFSSLSFRDKVGSCLTKVPLSFRLHAHYAKAREIDGHFKEAAMAYETAQEYDNAIRFVFHNTLIHVHVCQYELLGNHFNPQTIPMNAIQLIMMLRYLF